MRPVNRPAKCPAKLSPERPPKYTAKAKLRDEQVKKIRRRVHAGERITDLTVEYDVNRKTIRRRLDALELADAERARRTAARRAEEKRMKRLLGPDYRNPARAPELGEYPLRRLDDLIRLREVGRDRDAASTAAGDGTRRALEILCTPGQERDVGSRVS